MQTIIYIELVESKQIYIRAAVEREALERSAILFGFSASPFRCPLRLRYEHPILAVLLLPHLLSLRHELMIGLKFD